MSMSVFHCLLVSEDGSDLEFYFVYFTYYILLCTLYAYVYVYVYIIHMLCWCSASTIQIHVKTLFLL